MAHWTKFYKKHNGLRIRLLKMHVKQAVTDGKVSGSLKRYLADIDACQKLWSKGRNLKDKTSSEFYEMVQMVNRELEPVRAMQGGSKSWKSL